MADFSSSGVRPTICIWHCDDFDGDEVFETSCGHAFQLTTGTPEENGFQYCCYCGKPLETTFSSDDASDDGEEESDGVVL